MRLKWTGVFEDLPQNTHLRFDMLIPFSTLGEWDRSKPGSGPEFYNYVRLYPGTDPEVVEAKFPAFAKKYLGEIMQEHGFEARFGLATGKKIFHPQNHIWLKEISANANEKTLYFSAHHCRVCDCNCPY